jgi:hypothetical protein
MVRPSAARVCSRVQPHIAAHHSYFENRKLSWAASPHPRGLCLLTRGLTGIQGLYKRSMLAPGPGPPRPPSKAPSGLGARNQVRRRLCPHCSKGWQAGPASASCPSSRPKLLLRPRRTTGILLQSIRAMNRPELLSHIPIPLALGQWDMPSRPSLASGTRPMDSR